jgi:hypothetical protein
MHNSERQKREKKLRERAKRQRLYESIRREEQKYPTFLFQNEERAEPRFVQAVKDIVDEFSFADLPEHIRNWYAKIKEDKQFLLEFISYNGGVDPRVLAYTFHMGEHIYKTLSDSVKNLVLFNDLRVIPAGKELILQFNGLKRAKGAGGTVYYSAAEPKIKFGSKEYVVSFSTHAIEQTAARIVARPFSYAGAGDAFAFVNHCRRYDPVVLSDGCPAFSFFDKCCKGFMSWNYVVAVFGKEPTESNYYRRIGYCPLVFEGNFAKAKTLLPPGYRTTPEERCLNILSQKEYENYNAIIQTPICSYLKNGVFLIPPGYFNPTVYFNKFVPQIIQSKVPLYQRL